MNFNQVSVGIATVLTVMTRLGRVIDRARVLENRLHVHGLPTD